MTRRFNALSGALIVSLATANPGSAADAPVDLAAAVRSATAASKYDAAKADKSKAPPALKAGALVGAGTNPLARATAATKRIGRDQGLSRDLHDTQIYRQISPSVVLIVTESGLGSGSLIDDTGTVLTNLHVIDNAKEIGVLLKPRQEGAKLSSVDAIRAEVIRINAEKDLALLKLFYVPDGVTPIKLGKLDDVNVGADVHAIGHPKGESWTYTKGIISQVRTEYNWTSEDRIKHKATVIQTQTPISPGNSGGPLLDDNGVLIGVNSFKTSDGENLNFAVSISDVEDFLAQKGNVEAQRTTLSIPFKETAGCRDPQILYEGPNIDNDAYLRILDTRCTGKPNAEYVLPKDEKEPLVLTLFENGNFDNSTAVYVDYSRNAEWQFSLWRETPSADWETACYHERGEVTPVLCQKYVDFVAQAKQSKN